MLPVVIIWVWLCAYLNCAGWVLSAAHALNREGYAVALVLGLGILLAWKYKTSARILSPAPGSKLRWRLRHAFPLCFTVLAVLAFLGGALYLPANYDAAAYRTPRVLNWLAEGHWYWIHTEFARLNTRTAGFEWVTAPLLLFSGTDRLVFLANIICFLLLPGRIFAVLTRLGVKPRTAWYWMWLFPSGYGYLLQAGSVVNDMFGGFMAMVAFEFALRAAERKAASFLCTSLPAAGLMTAVKAFNLVLLLPWALAALPALPMLRRRPAMALIAIFVAAGASLLPTAILNIHECGDWTGLKAEQATLGGSGKGLRFVANAINLPLDNIAPPIFPFTSAWNQFVDHSVLAKMSAAAGPGMEMGLAKFRLPDLHTEVSAGVGMGLTFLLLVLLVKKLRAGKFWTYPFWSHETLIPLATWASLGVFMMETGAAGPARYLLPFYVLLATPILTGTVPDNFLRSRVWYRAALLIFALAMMVVVIVPQRPLWPAQTILNRVDAHHSPIPRIRRTWIVYDTYGARGNVFGPAVASLPPDANPLGFMGFDEPETSLWRPFGSRRILQICHDDTPAQMSARGIKYALVSERFFAQHLEMTTAEWLQNMNATVIGHYSLQLRAGQDPGGWLLVRFE